MIDFNRLLNLPNTKIVSINETKPGQITICVETTEDHTVCHVCKKTITHKHGKDKERKLKHLPVFDNEVTIIYQPNRYICDECKDHPTTTATPSWHNQNSSFTKAYEQH